MHKIKALLQRIRKFKPEPENSIAFRLSVLLVVECAVYAVLKLEDWPAFSWTVLAGTAAAYGISYVRRTQKNIALKILLALGMMYALYNFLQNLILSPFEPRIPLANLLIWLQLLHSFDLPSRIDLGFSLLVAFVLMAVASVLSYDTSIILYLTVFLVFMLLALTYYHMSVNNALPVNYKFVFKTAMHNLGLLVILAAVIFSLMPRVQQSFLLRPLAASLNIPLPKFNFKSGIQNPGYPSGTSSTLPYARKFDPDNYFGFNNYLDLNYRGKLSSRIAMLVNANQPLYYRGVEFDAYNGAGWVISDVVPPKKITTNTPPFILPVNILNAKHQVQIFYLKQDLPNVIFSAYQVQQIYFPSDTLFQDGLDNLLTPFPLEKGMIYSCISMVPQIDPELLELNRNRIWNIKSRHWYNSKSFNSDRRALQLPAISDRVKFLTLDITKNAPSIYDKVQALNIYLKNSYPYDLDVPAFPEGAETTDYFLFEAKRGYCEHFATALTVMCRILGIPSCLVTGYAPGTYNPFISLYEIRNFDAHAWSEALIPGIGWLPFDPTPGFNAMPSNPQYETNIFPLLSIFKYLNKIFAIKFHALSWGSLKMILYAFIGLGLILAAGYAMLRIKGLSLRFHLMPYKLLSFYDVMLRLLRNAGAPKAGYLTPYEYQLKFKDEAYYSLIAYITQVFVLWRYGRKNPDVQTLSALFRAVKELKLALKRKVKPVRESFLT